MSLDTLLDRVIAGADEISNSDTVIEQAVHDMDVWPIVTIFSALSLVVATFVSHSIASVLVAPIAARIGDALDPPHPRLLVMATALICSAGMALPVSGFPNLMAVNLEDDVGQRYLTVEDFLKTGVSTHMTLPGQTMADDSNLCHRFLLLCWRSVSLSPWDTCEYYPLRSGSRGADKDFTTD